METMQRYAVYYAPREGDFATAGSAWLGWDALRGRHVPHPDIHLNLDDLTDLPRRYGFHGTLRAPFRLAEGYTYDDLCDSVKELAASLDPVVCNEMHVREIRGFLALLPEGGEAGLHALAARVVEGTDILRAPLTGDEIARWQPETLGVRQRDLLHGWGYPFVMEEFRFHISLTRPLPSERLATGQSAAEAYFSAHLPRPFVIEDLCLFGEDLAGRFHLLGRYALSG
jgi:hypothetical protein